MTNSVRNSQTTKVLQDQTCAQLDDKIRTQYADNQLLQDRLAKESAALLLEEKRTLMLKQELELKSRQVSPVIFDVEAVLRADEELTGEERRQVLEEYQEAQQSLPEDGERTPNDVILKGLVHSQIKKRRDTPHPNAAGKARVPPPASSAMPPLPELQNFARPPDGSLSYVWNCCSHFSVDKSWNW